MQVGSAPCVTNYVCVCVTTMCVYLLSRVIDMQKRKWVRASPRKKMISGLLVSAPSICITCHNFWSPRRTHTHAHTMRTTQTWAMNRILLCLDCWVPCLFTKSCTFRLWRSQPHTAPPSDRHWLWFYPAFLLHAGTFLETLGDFGGRPKPLCWKLLQSSLVPPSTSRTHTGL